MLYNTYYKTPEKFLSKETSHIENLEVHHLLVLSIKKKIPTVIHADIQKFYEK